MISFSKVRAALFDAAEQRVRVGLKKNHEVGLHDLGLQDPVDLLVERQFVFVEREVGEDAVLVEEIVADRDPRKEVGLRISCCWLKRFRRKNIWVWNR